MKKVPKSCFQSQFWMSRINEKKIFFHLRMSIQETIFCEKKLYFLGFIFEPLYFLKPCPIFDGPSFINGFFFPLSMLIVDQKSCFLGPTILKFHNQTVLTKSGHNFKLKQTLYRIYLLTVSTIYILFQYGLHTVCITPLSQ